MTPKSTISKQPILSGKKERREEMARAWFTNARERLEITQTYIDRGSWSNLILEAGAIIDMILLGRMIWEGMAVHCKSMVDAEPPRDEEQPSQAEMLHRLFVDKKDLDITRLQRLDQIDLTTYYTQEDAQKVLTKALRSYELHAGEILPAPASVGRHRKCFPASESQSASSQWGNLSTRPCLIKNSSGAPDGPASTSPPSKQARCSSSKPPARSKDCDTSWRK